MISCAIVASTGTMFAGCGSKQVARSGGLVAVKTRPGYVRIADLVAQHPLQQDVRRLQVEEHRLDSLAGHLPSNNISDSASLSGYVLPALNAASPGPRDLSTGSASARNSRRLAARKAFEDDVTSALARYSAERERRHTLLTDQRRSELLAVDASREAESERTARDAEDAKVRAAIEGFLGTVLGVQSRIAVLDAQLDKPPLDVFAAAPGSTETQAQIDELKKYASLVAAQQDKPAAERQKVPEPTGISMLTRLRVSREAQIARLSQLQADLDKIKVAGSGASDEAVQRIQKERLAEIDRQLTALSDEVRMRILIEGENKSMREVLDSEARVARRFAADSVLADGPFSGSGKASLPIIFGARTAQLNRADIEKAISRIQLQQTRLVRYIRLDVVTAVHDAAVERNIDVLAIETETQTPEALAGRTDMTGQFEKWILQPGQDVGALSGSTKANRVESRSGG